MHELNGEEEINISTLLQIQVNIFMIMLLIVTAIHSYFRLNMRNDENKVFLSINILILIILILEIISIIVNGKSSTGMIYVNKMVNILGFTLTPLPIFLIYIFIKFWIKDSEVTEKNNEMNGLIILFIINTLTSILSLNHNFVFSISDENYYSRGSLFGTSLSISLMYFITIIKLIYKNRKWIQHEEIVIFIVATVIPIILGLIQLKNGIYLTIWNSATISIIIVYVFILNESMTKDPLTGLGNRIYYNQYMFRIEKRQSVKLAIVYIDMDGLKKINDNFGHNVGDDAIKLMSRILKATLSRDGKAIRLGGDEFVICIEDDNVKRIEEYMKKVKGKLESYNKNELQNYTIGLSYGIAIYDSTKENVEDLVRRADQLMYEQKQRKYMKET